MITNDMTISSRSERREMISSLCSYYINLVYARKGYLFSSRIWNGLFTMFGWYTGTTKNPTFSEQEKNRVQDIDRMRKELAFSN